MQTSIEEIHSNNDAHLARSVSPQVYDEIQKARSESFNVLIQSLGNFFKKILRKLK
ncbi:MAG: hypothetical protein WC467_03570 [Patescibacteria group bacterium]